MNNTTSFGETIYSWEGWVFNFLCAIYFAFISPLVKDASIATMQDESDFLPWLGIALLLVSLLEIYAFPKKMKYVHRAAIEHGEKMNSGFVLWMFHAVISILITFMIIESFGYDIVAEEGRQEPTWWMMLLIFAVVIKELIFLFTIMGLHDETNQLEEYKRPNKKEWILDLILLAYACLAYTATWEAIGGTANMEKDNTIMYVVNLFAASIIFLIFYMPIRIPYYLEEMLQLKTTGDILKFVGGISIVWAAAMMSL